MEVADEFLRALANLRVWRRAGISAPHKPVLVLFALARLQQGLPRLMPFSEVERPLGDLIGLAMPGKLGQPQYPFWRLQADGVWEVVAIEPLRRRRMSTDVPVTVLRRAGASGGFVTRFHDELLRDPLLVDEAVRVVSRRLPSDRRSVVLDAIGWTGPALPKPKPETTIDRLYTPVDLHALPAPARPAQRDPDQYGRGWIAHQRTQTSLASFVSENGMEPRSPYGTTAPFDLLWRYEGLTFVAEVKSTTDENEERQLRLGLGQVLRYRQALRLAGEPAVAVLVVERPPRDPSWVDLCDEVDVVLAWPEVFATRLARQAASAV